MCVICGCSDQAKVTVDGIEVGGEGHFHVHADGSSHDHDHTHDRDDAHDHAHGHVHHHGHGQPHSHSPPSLLMVPGQDATSIRLEAAILGKNQLLAERNRGYLLGREIVALNLMSSPGSGKTTLLEKTILALQPQLTVTVVEGDQATANDAERIRASGAKAVQINTGTGCHLEADMLQRAVQLLNPPRRSLLVIENVGNLVCPALFDLGESAKVVILSVTEGEDKPLKYPHMFSVAQVMVVSKIDLLPYLEIDMARLIANARHINPGIQVFALSAKTGVGMDAWTAWLTHSVQQLEHASLESAR